MDKLCEKFKINHINLTPYHTKMNGPVEAANKSIKRIIDNMTTTYKDWHKILPLTLHGYHTLVRTSTGATPFYLVYSMKVVLPLELEIPSLRVLMEAKLDEVECHYEQLNSIEEKRLAALSHGQLYQRRLMRAYNKKLHPRSF